MAGLFPVILLVLVLFGILPAANVVVRKLLKSILIYETGAAGSRRKANTFTHHWRGGCVVFSEILENFGHP
jgi:hypothetical protein